MGRLVLDNESFSVSPMGQCQSIARVGHEQSLDKVSTANLQLFSVDEGYLLYGSKSGAENTIRVLLTGVPFAVVYDASDDAEPEHRSTEAKIHEFIEDNPESLEDGLRILHHEYQTEVGTIEFVAADEDGNWVVIEVKNQYAKLSHVDQLRRYVKHYKKRTTHRYEDC